MPPLFIKNYLKAIILLDRERPKVKMEDAFKVLTESGAKLESKSPDLGVVIGGDGVFCDYGRTMSIPLLFVGVRTKKATGSKAFLAQTYFDTLSNALKAIKKGRYRVTKYRRVEVLKNNRKLGESFTDVYLERGVDNGCLRFEICVRGTGSEFTDFSIVNGVVVSTKAGSTGYYSYPDKLRNVDWLEPNRLTLIGENELGICHILPTYTLREGTRDHPLRYTIPWNSSVKIKLTRRSAARLYGATNQRQGVKINSEDTITIKSSANFTRVVQIF